MQTFARNPLFMPGIALAAAGAVAISPITPVPAPVPNVAVSAPHARGVQLPVELSASVTDLLTLPIIRQWLVNQIDDIATLAVGLSASGAAIGAELVALPGTLVDITQLILGGHFEDALDAIIDNIVHAVDVIGSPTLGAIILRRDRNLEVALNFQTAVPAAVVGFSRWAVEAIDDVLTSWITGGRTITAPLFDGDFGNIVPAIGDTINVVIQGLRDGAQDLVEGTYYLQQTIAVAMGADPPAEAPTLPPARPASSDAVLAAPASAAPGAADVPDLDVSATPFALDTPTEAAVTGTEPDADQLVDALDTYGADETGADHAKAAADKAGEAKVAAAKAAEAAADQADEAAADKADADTGDAGKADVDKSDAGGDEAGADGADGAKAGAGDD
jgi:hypothetical protein